MKYFVIHFLEKGYIKKNLLYVDLKFVQLMIYNDEKQVHSRVKIRTATPLLH